MERTSGTRHGLLRAMTRSGPSYGNSAIPVPEGFVPQLVAALFRTTPAFGSQRWDEDDARASLKRRRRPRPHPEHRKLQENNDNEARRTGVVENEVPEERLVRPVEAASEIGSNAAAYLVGMVAVTVPAIGAVVGATILGSQGSAWLGAGTIFATLGLVATMVSLLTRWWTQRRLEQMELIVWFASSSLRIEIRGAAEAQKTLLALYEASKSDDRTSEHSDPERSDDESHVATHRPIGQ